MVEEAMVVVAKVLVPVKVEVPVTPRFKVAKRVPSNAKFAESITRPPVVVNNARPLVSDETASWVVVAFVVVALVELELAKIAVPVKVGEFENTRSPPPAEPVSSETRAASSTELVNALDKPKDEVATWVTVFPAPPMSNGIKTRSS